MSNRMIKTIAVCAIALLLLATSAGGILSADKPPCIGNGSTECVLAGDAGGSCNLYEIAYPGGEAELEVELVYSPADPISAKCFGFNVYGYDRFEGRGEPDGDGSVGVLVFSYAEDEPNTLVIQVYNYGEWAIGYTLTVDGLPEESTPAPIEAVAAPAEEQAECGPVMGSNAGNEGGAIQLHTFAYLGDEEDVTVSMTYSPADPSFAKAIGFVIYAPTGRVIARGVPSDEGGVMEATFSSDTKGEFGVQVYNYTDGVVLNYKLEFEFEE
jgi:hypothetical protein